MPTALEAFDACLRWLKATYATHEFFTERDIVWTCQKWLLREFREGCSQWRVFHEHPMVPGPHRAVSSDLALLDDAGKVGLAVEVKYEPSRRRAEGNEPTLLLRSLPRCDWQSMELDLAKCRQCVGEGRAERAVFLLVDEGATYYRRHAQEPFTNTAWEEWMIPGTGHSLYILKGVFGPLEPGATPAYGNRPVKKP